MNYIYPAVFYPEDGGKYSVIFPDLNDLATYGDSLADGSGGLWSVSILILA